MLKINLNQIAWKKGDGLVPAVIQNPDNSQVLMLGYMDRAALVQTIDSGKVTFFSRSKKCLWTKGETSGNWLDYVSLEIDCDCDTILIQARPQGPVCHTGMVSCFNDISPDRTLFLSYLTKLIGERQVAMPSGSYTTSLFNEGKARIAQKVGEEGVELAIARMKDDKTEIASEAADLLFHMMILLQDADLTINDAIHVLETRHK
ncbi:bifunctional phosphoribosyl-AMP cyclohydrolase/phosphoribosyl-ATP diphosphatase HisIE [Candidatus Puniceispirillum sp.]|nr:bifunctional phosphoribosyl-AMP cyclohydrolase/phosphoribosyl-ATP diphosphatase HisIE [Candidatus Puniceispirillum sp.]